MLIPRSTTETVEAFVRRQLATALGGKRGIVEAALPTILFTVIYLTTKEVRLAIGISGAAALLFLAVRLAQRSQVQFAFNALFGIGIGFLFVWLSASWGGSADDQTLAYFLPGILYNAGYSVVMVGSILVGWPIMGFLVGSIAGDPTAWHADPRVVRLCRNLTWCLVAPCVIRVAVQLPLYLSGKAAEDASTQIAALGVAKIAMGWPLQLAAFAAMVWLVSRRSEPATAEK
ncbi:MAG: DUF3159 domain-containing protein [Nocardioidaceae bacterium]|nr:MAG: DUF3159 domain-containing protein [Nocardioidaceae bacterium]